MAVTRFQGPQLWKELAALEGEVGTVLEAISPASPVTLPSSSSEQGISQSWASSVLLGLVSPSVAWST